MTLIPEENSQFRITRMNSKIESSDGDMSFEQEEIIEITPEGDVTTITNENAFELDGEIIHNIQIQIKGRCINNKCRQYLTQRTLRSCYECRIHLCYRCSKHDRKYNVHYCKNHYRKIKIKRFFFGILRLLLLPFVERVDR